MPPAIFSTKATAYLGEPSAMPSKSWGPGKRPGRRQPLTPVRCGTFRKPTTPATGKPDHNAANHPKSPDLKEVKPYDINSARNKQVRRHGADPFAYFEWVFEKLMHNPPPEQLVALLPVEWIKTRPSALQTAEARIA